MKKTKKHDLAKLEEFFMTVAKLTLNHDDQDGYAVIYASHLGIALAKVDPNWFEVERNNS